MVTTSLRERMRVAPVVVMMRDKIGGQHDGNGRRAEHDPEETPPH
jgi:hypothetical protein